MNYGPYIDAAIERSRLSNAEIASRVGVTDDAVRKWRRGEGVRLGNLERLADALGCLVGDLLPNSGGGAQAEVFEPIAAALMGLSTEEIRDQVLMLANQAQLVRNAILRRATTERVIQDTRETADIGYTPAKPTTDVQRPTPQLIPKGEEPGERPNAPATRSTYRIAERRQ